MSGGGRGGHGEHLLPDGLSQSELSISDGLEVDQMSSDWLREDLD